MGDNNKIYLDNCCYNRPFDDQTQLRIRLEAEAIKTILKLHEQGPWEVVVSQVNIFELKNTPISTKKLKLQDMFYKIQSVAPLTASIIQRARYFESVHIDAMDAMHLACAENNADILLTVDDKFLKRAELITNLEIEIANPLTWLQRVIQ
ncbi:MAG: PIN domain-containing protein [Thiotrichaceae bacterium]